MPDVKPRYAALPPERFIELRYDDLDASPMAVLERIYDQLQLEVPHGQHLGPVPWPDDPRGEGRGDGHGHDEADRADERPRAAGNDAQRYGEGEKPEQDVRGGGCGVGLLPGAERVPQHRPHQSCEDRDQREQNQRDHDLGQQPGDTDREFADRTARLLDRPARLHSDVLAEVARVGRGNRGVRCERIRQRRDDHGIGQRVLAGVLAVGRRTGCQQQQTRQCDRKR